MSRDVADQAHTAFGGTCRETDDRRTYRATLGLVAIIGLAIGVSIAVIGLDLRRQAASRPFVAGLGVTAPVESAGG